MIQSIVKGAGFGGALAYVMDPAKGARVLAGTEAFDATPRQIARSFRAQCGDASPRRPVFHASLSLAPGEHLSDAQWQGIAQRYLRHMGFTDQPWILVRHADTDHEHVHIVASRVGPSGKLVSDSWDYKRGERLLRQLERELGLRQVISSHDAPARQPTSDELRAAIRTETPNLKHELRQILAEAAADRPSFAVLVERLEALGVEVVVHLHPETGLPRGLSYRIDGSLFSGSDLGRAFTWSGLSRDLEMPPEALDLALRLASGHPPIPPQALDEIVRQAAFDQPTFATFRTRLEAAGVKLHLHLAQDGKPRGLSYEHQGRVVSGTELGKSFTFQGVQRKLGVRVTPQDAPALRQAAPADPPAKALEDHIRTAARGGPASEPIAPARDPWSDAALRRLSSELARVPSVKTPPARSEAPSPIALGSALRLYYATGSPAAAARAVIRKLPAGSLVADALRFAASFHSPIAALSFALSLTSRAVSTLKRSASPAASEPTVSTLKRPATDSTAHVRHILRAYARAALADAPDFAVFRGRLETVGIRVGTLATTEGHPQLAFQLANHTVPAMQIDPALSSHVLNRTLPQSGNRHDLPDLSRPRRSDAPTAHRDPRHRPPDPAAARHHQPAHAPSRATAPPGARSASRPDPGLEPPARGAARSLGSTAPSQPAAVADSPLRPRAAHRPDPPAARSLSAASPQAVASSRTAPRADDQLRAARRDPAPPRRPLTRQLDALGAQRYDLRITAPDGRKTYLRDLSPQQIAERQPALATAARRGYRVELRANDPHLHLLRNVEGPALRVAAAAGFEPAVAVEVGPGRYDVWLRHQPATAAQVPNLRSAASLAFDRPTTERPSLFGSLASVSQDNERVARLASRRAHSYSRSQDLAVLLQPSPPPPTTSRSLVHPTPADLRRQQPRLTPRQADRLWTDHALRAGLSQEATFRTLSTQGARRNAHPYTRARYAARVLAQPRPSPAPALTNAALERVVATVLTLPLKAVRLTLFVVNVAQRLVRHL